MKKSLFLVFVILACLNFIYFGIQAVNKTIAVVQADGFDNLELQDQPLTPTELKDLEKGYREMARESRSFELENGDIPQTWAEIKLERDLDDILENKPARIISLNYPRKYIIIHISGWMTEGTDTACEMAVEIFHAITGLGLTLEVHGEFVPSAVNPMDHRWTTYLIDHDGRTNRIHI